MVFVVVVVVVLVVVVVVVLLVFVVVVVVVRFLLMFVVCLSVQADGLQMRIVMLLFVFACFAAFLLCFSSSSFCYRRCFLWLSPYLFCC